MDTAEQVADRYLREKFDAVVYEPDGNIPPDFVVNRTIGVEVRRLNQNSEENGSYKGLEEIAIPLSHKVRNLLRSYGEPTYDRSWFVMYRFSRPVPGWREIRPEIDRVLREQLANPREELVEVEVHDRFALSIAPGSKKYGTHFCLGGYSDFDSGGWLLSELERNLQICIEEKLQKIAPYKSNYSEWWLILVDHIAYAMDKFDREIWNERAIQQGGWSRVVLLDPRGINGAYEI